MFVLKDDKTLVEMKPASFVTEDDFQRLLESFPALLAGAQINTESPRQWILVAREKSVPSEDGGGGRWSVDHLFLDQDGIPTIVEVKRQSDTRIRREVVGQMLDYAANGVAYWKIEEIISHFMDNCASRAVDPDETLAKLLGPEANPQEFWNRVNTNLQAGKIRMLFVADHVPPELRRIVEFLNKQMSPADVLALELQQFEGDGGLKTLVPRLYGQTEEALQKKSAGSAGRVWDEHSFYEELNRNCGPEIVNVARKIAAWMKVNADEVFFGAGKIVGSMPTLFVWNGLKLYPLQLNTTGRVYVNFGYCIRGPFESEEKRLEWVRRLNSANGIDIPESAIDRFPSLQLNLFQDEARLKGFLEAMDWFVSELRKPHATA